MAVEEFPNGGDGVRSALGSTEGHKSAVGLLGIVIDLDRLLKNLYRGLGMTGVELVFGQ